MSNRTSTSDPPGTGWVVFAGAMLLIVGSVNVITGIGAIGDSKFFVDDAKFVFGGLHTWGWVMLLIGAVQLLTAVGLMRDNSAALWAAIGFTSLNALAQLLAISSYPFLSLALFSLDLLVIYGLVTYGGRERA